jgi:poly(3-hydroxyalkanoate) synthetase
LGNNRGNQYSCTNKELSTDSSEFWDHSFQEMAEIDLPKFINTVKQKTNRDKISVMAHSQGGTQLLASLAEFPELQNSIGKFAKDNLCILY